MNVISSNNAFLVVCSSLVYLSVSKLIISWHSKYGCVPCFSLSSFFGDNILLLLSDIRYASLLLPPFSNSGLECINSSTRKNNFYISVFICCYSKCSARSFVPFWFCFSHAILLASPISCYNFHFQTSILMQMKWFKARFRCLLPVRLSIATPVLLMYVMFPKPKVSSLVFHVVWFFLEETRIFNWSSTVGILRGNF